MNWAVTSAELTMASAMARLWPGPEKVIKQLTASQIRSYHPKRRAPPLEVPDSLCGGEAAPGVDAGEIDVAAAQDDADAPASGIDPSLQHGCCAKRTGRLDDHLQALPQIEHRAEQHGIVHRRDVARVGENERE